MKNIKNAIKRFLAITVLYGITLYLMPPVKVLSNSDKTPSEPKTKTSVRDGNFGNIPVYFEENQGQFDKQVKYFARGTSGYSLFLTGTEAVYVLQEKTGDRRQETRDELTQDLRLKTQDSAKAVAVYMKLTGANENAVSIGLEEMPHRTNYFKGEELNWRTEIPNFRQIQMENIYQGIDAVWKGKPNGSVQYDFIVKPNADPNLIKWEIEGAEAVEIDEKGDLLIKTEYGEIRQQKPFTYQENSEGLRQEVESQFKIKSTNNEQLTTNKYRIGFEIENFDRTKTLTIDPSVNLSNLAFSTYLGGNGNDEGTGIAVDRAGNVYVTGETNSISFPVSPGTFDTNLNGSFDVFVSKFNANGSELIYSTYLGGSFIDRAEDLAIDRLGNVYITGRTADSTTDFPTTAGAFDVTHNGVNDVFVTKLDANGSNLIYSTFIGGSGSDEGLDIAVDTPGNTYITGNTHDDTIDFPTTTGVYSETHKGNADAFVTKLNPTGTALIHSTLIGGTGGDTAWGITVDSAGNPYITGETLDDTTAYPTTAGAFDTVHNGGRDVFVTKLSSNFASLSYSTFLGGSGNDIGHAIAIDLAGNAYITGETADSTTDFPTTFGVLSETHNGLTDAFITELNAAGSSLLYSTFIGGTGHDRSYSIIVDNGGFATITGLASNNFPTTPGAFDETSSSGVFVSKLFYSGSALMYSTYYGNGDGLGIASDSSGNIFITGQTFLGVPVTPEAFQTVHHGPAFGTDAFVAKFGDFSISGRTVDQSGIPLPNSAVALSGGRSGFMLSDPTGYFGFSDTISGRNFTVAATHTLYNFTPNTFQINNFSANEELVFLGRPTSSGPTAAPADLGGEVRSTAGNVGLPNTKLTLIDVVSGDVFATTTDADGNYEFEAVTTGMFYLVVPEREGYNFNPGIYEVNHLDQNLGLDFIASPNSPRPVRDFDGDGKTDLAVFRPENGVWYIWNTQDNSFTAKQFGLAGDIPVASDYDGDNRADIAVYRPTEGNWYWLDSLDGDFHAVHFGQTGDLPVQGDFDGDNKTDLAVYRPSTGIWHQLLSENVNYQSIRFGLENDIPISADYDADDKADLSVYRNGIWYRLRSSDLQVEGFQFGSAGDKPQVGDFDGDGRMDTAVYRPSNGAWYWLESSDGDFQAKQFGNSTDAPVPADYNGDGRFEQAVFRNGIWFVLRHDNSYYSTQFGQTDDIPISGN